MAPKGGRDGGPKIMRSFVSSSEQLRWKLSLVLRQGAGAFLSWELLFFGKSVFVGIFS